MRVSEIMSVEASSNCGDGGGCRGGGMHDGGGICPPHGAFKHGTYSPEPPRRADSADSDSHDV